MPGGLEVWKQILSEKGDSKTVREWSKHASHMKTSEQFLEAMFAFSRVDTEVTPLEQYLVFSELENSRDQRHSLRPETYLLLSRKFADFSDQYLISQSSPNSMTRPLLNLCALPRP
jgi:hypothetical protein